MDLVFSVYIIFNLKFNSILLIILFGKKCSTASGPWYLIKLILILS